MLPVAFHTTVWKFEDFSATRIFREIKFKNFRGQKLPFSTHLEALNSDFYEFLHSMKAAIYQNQKFKAPKNAKKAFFVLSDPPKLVSRKIRVAEKS